ncbi:Translin [Armillaria novae-zelandiae]|uniref:Translin n=1 Tax=Armillaria novae-zelandiae TaxID=153914 RepID=A0AA39NWP5_9AGAR|nr:Translin [Armillaria novae-zelandiae]
MTSTTTAIFDAFRQDLDEHNDRRERLIKVAASSTCSGLSAILREHLCYFPLTISDYMLGLSDLTGELMRYSISGLTKRGGRLQAMDTLGFVRNCKADFEGFTPHVRFLSKKQRVTAQSLQKIEDAVYAIVVRSSEYDLPPEMLDDIVSQTFSNSASDRRGHKRRYADSEDEYDDEAM